MLAGGVFAGVIGPQLVIFTKDLWPPYLFAATYIAQAVLAASPASCSRSCSIPPPGRARRWRTRGRPLREIARTPRSSWPRSCGVASYAMMNLVMTSAPLAMVGCGHSVTDATLGIQWHVHRHVRAELLHRRLIVRFGVERIVLTGLALDARERRRRDLPASRSRISGSALTLLGLGWNFAFIGATTHRDLCHRPEERNKVQSFNDFLVFGSMAIGSFASGKLLAHFGWDAVNSVVFPPILAAGGLLVWLMLRQRPREA